MENYVFVGWPVNEAQSEAVCRGIHVDTILETAAAKNSGGVGIPYVIQERWIDAHKVVFISGLRLIGEQERIGGC
jgi:hypothetical protein